MQSLAWIAFRRLALKKKAGVAKDEERGWRCTRRRRRRALHKTKKKAGLAQDEEEGWPCRTRRRRLALQNTKKKAGLAEGGDEGFLEDEVEEGLP